MRTLILSLLFASAIPSYVGPTLSYVGPAASYVGPTFRSGILVAQSPPTSDLRYDVVSIKKKTTDRPVSNATVYRPDGGFTFINTTTMHLLTQSFLGFGPADMIGWPDWVMSDPRDARGPFQARRPHREAGD